MHKQRSITQVILICCAVLIAYCFSSVLFYRQQLTSLSGIIKKGGTKPYSSITTASPPNTISSIARLPSDGSLCNCSFAISSDSNNIEFLITSPSGLQQGYITSSDSYVDNIPNASYGVQQGLIDDTGLNPPMSDVLYFGVSEVENGYYTLQVIGKAPGNYHLNIAIVWGPEAGKSTSIDGSLISNQVDKYSISFPKGIIQKVDN